MILILHVLKNNLKFTHTVISVCIKKLHLDTTYAQMLSVVPFSHSYD